MTERVYKSSRGEVHYMISEPLDSNKRTLVFLHGLTADHTLFDKQTAYFADAYNIIAWDAPAHGLSRPYSDFTYGNAAEDLMGILDEHNLSSVYLIGQSMGGYISQSFMLRYHDMADGFVGIDTCPYGEGYYSRSDKWWLRQIEWMSMLYPLGFLKKSIAKQNAVTEYGRANMLKALEPYGKKELCHLMGIGFAGFLSENRDIIIRCPVLLLAGEHDRTGKVLSYCRAWEKKTGFTLKIISNAAHNSNADNPDEVNREIESFLSKSNGE